MLRADSGQTLYGFPEASNLCRGARRSPEARGCAAKSPAARWCWVISGAREAVHALSPGCLVVAARVWSWPGVDDVDGTAPAAAAAAARRVLSLGATVGVPGRNASGGRRGLARGEEGFEACSHAKQARLALSSWPSAGWFAHHAVPGMDPREVCRTLAGSAMCLVSMVVASRYAPDT